MKQTFKSVYRKNELLKLLSIFVFLLILAGNGIAQNIWEPATGPYGGSVYAITNTPNGTIYAGTLYGGVFQSTDNGLTWQSTGFGGAAYSLLALSDSILFAGSHSSSLYRSTDGGETWEIKNNGLPSSSVRKMVRSSDGNIFAATGEGIFRSGNQGELWVAVNTSLTDLNVNTLAITGNNILYAGTQSGGLFISSSAGELWVQETNVIPVAAVGAITVDDNDNIYVGMGSNDGLFLSNDGGASWNNIGMTNRIITALDITSDGVLYVGTWQSGVYFTADEGGTWISADLGYTPLNVETIHVNPSTDDTFVGCIWYNGGGIYFLGSDGTEWEPRNQGLLGTRIWKMAVSPASNTIFAGDYYNGLYRSRDMGLTWESVGQGMIDLQSTFIRGLAAHPSGAIFTASSGGGVFRSINDGDDWMRVYGAQGTYAFLGAIAVRNDGVVFIGENDGDGGIFKSLDEGETWEDITNGMDNKDITCIAFNHDNEIYVGTTRDGIYRSVTDGDSWSPVGTELSTYEIRDIAINNQNHVYTTTSDGVWKTTDNSTWSKLGSAVLGNKRAIEVNSKDHIFVGLSDLWISKDDGFTWLSFDQGLESSEINDLVLNIEEHLFAGTYHGVFRTFEPTTTVRMKFTVKMGNEDGFDPSTQSVVVIGPFNNWGIDGEWLLEGQEDADLTYSGTFSVPNPFDFMINDTLEYKFAISTDSGADDNIAELLRRNRIAIWDGMDDLDIEPVWFSNQKDFTLMKTSAIAVNNTDSRGVAWVDYDNDGYEDVIITDAGTSARNDLFHNNRNGTFSQITIGSIVTDVGDSRTACWGDYNNDGYEDLYVTNLGEDNNYLYKNNGDGTFTRITDNETVNYGGNSVGAVWADFNNDGFLDLFVTNSGVQLNYLFMNNQDESFTRVTGQSIVNDIGDSRGCAAADFDNDGDVDVFVANAGEGEGNPLYMNDGEGNFTAQYTGTVPDQRNVSSGGSWGDFNNDGWLDLYITNRNGSLNTLFQNNKAGGFIVVDLPQVLTDSTDSRGSAWVDYDNDGLLDLFVANAGIQPNILYKQETGGTFTTILTGPIAEDPVTDTHGAAWGDYNNDGSPDLVIANSGGSNALYRNNITENHNVNLRLIGTLANKSALGTVVMLYYKNDEGFPTTQRRDVLGQTGFLGQNTRIVSFGIGQQMDVDSLVIYWSAGTKQVISEGIGTDQLMYITEPNPMVPPPPPILNIPQNGATNIVTNPMLSWNAAGDAYQYHLQFADNAGYDPLMFEDTLITAATVYDVSGLSRGTTYYWQVRAKNDAGWGSWSQSWNFTTTDSIPQIPPPQTILNSPADGSTNIVVNPTLNWNQASEASQYHLKFANNNAFDPIFIEDTVITQTSYGLNGLQYDQSYYWQVRAKNEAGWGPWSEVWSFSTEQFSGTALPPVPTNPPDGQEGMPIPAPISWTSETTGNFAVQVATDTTFSNVVFGRTNITEPYTYASGLNYETTYYWRVNVTVSATTSDWSVFRSFKTYANQIPVTTQIPFPEHERRDDFSSSDYLMIGLPGSANAIFNDVFGSGAGESWMAYLDNGNTGNPEDYFEPYDGSNKFRFSTGRAFWVIHNGPINVNQSLPAATLNEFAQAEVAIHPGWNMITSPFVRQIAWVDVRAANNFTTDVQLWRYNRSNRTFEIATELEPVEGFYFNNPLASRTTLLIPYIDSFGKPLVNHDLLWDIEIKLNAGETKGASVRIGAALNAQEKRDQSDYLKPHAFADLADIYFKRPTWDAGSIRFGSDIRPPVSQIESWVFEVYMPSKTDAKLTFQEIQHIPEEFEVYLIDKTRQMYQDLRENDSYQFVSTTKYSEFEVIVGDAQAIEEIVSAIIPAEYSLGQNYPNPFNPVTTIPLSLPEQSEVTLKVYNLLGQEVVTLFKGSLHAGRHYFVWEGINQSNIKMPSGIYIYQMSTSTGYKFSGKMILLK